MPRPSKVKSVTVTIELETGEKRVIESRPGSISQNLGVAISEDLSIENDLELMRGGTMTDYRLQRTVTWTEQWTEMAR